MHISIAPHANTGVIAGLNWQVLDPIGESFFGHEQIPKLIEDGYRYFVKVKNGSEDNFGVTKNNDLELFRNQKLFSLAAMVASHPDFQGTTCLVMVSDPHSDEPHGLAAGLVSGNIVMDLAFALDRQYEVRDEFQSLCSKAGRQFQIFGDLACDDIDQDQRTTLEALSQSNDVKKIAPAPLKNEKYLLLVVVAVLGLILVLIVMGIWDWYKAEQQAEIDDERARRSSPEALYTQSVGATLTKPHLIMAVAADGLIETISNFPVELGGWQLTRIQCEQTQCNAKWRSIGGTYDGFQKLAEPSWGKLKLGSSDKDFLGDLATLNHSFELKLTKAKLPPLRDWPSAETFAFEQGIDWQKLKDYKWVGSLGSIEQQAIPTQVAPNAVAGHPQAIYGMSWSVTNQDWALGKLVLPLFKNNVTLQHFELNFGERSREVLFSAKGVAYVKK